VNTDTNTVYLVNEAFAEQWREFVTDPRDPFAAFRSDTEGAQ
jgi:hypothetical protein